MSDRASVIRIAWHFSLFLSYVFLILTLSGIKLLSLLTFFLQNSQFKINAKGYFGSFFFKPDIFELMTYSTKGRKKSSEKKINTYNFDDILACSSEGHREVEILELNEFIILHVKFIANGSSSVHWQFHLVCSSPRSTTVLIGSPLNKSIKTTSTRSSFPSEFWASQSPDNKIAKYLWSSAINDNTRIYRLFHKR